MKKLDCASILLIAAALAACTTTPPAAVTPIQAAGGDWLTYNRTYEGNRFSPLAEINRANVSGLRELCTYTLPEVTSLQTGPIVVDGVMYFTSDTISYAIDAGTCAERWHRARHSDSPSMLGVHRGFAYDNGRLFRGTSDVHVMAMNPADGATLWDVKLDVAAPGVTLPMAPIAYDGKVFVGNAGGDMAGVTGHVYALDQRDGHVVWKFDVVPSSALPSWPSAPHVPVSGGAFWTSFTLDTQHGLLYVPAGNPAPDFDLDLRRGDNLYSNSVIAIDIRNGRMVAYNQVVKHDTHDWDVDSPPALITTTGGKQIVASSNKDGLLSVLDRANGLNLLYQQPTTTRSNVDAALSREHKTRFCPGIQGGTEWNGAAYSPQFNSIYTGAVDWCASVQVQAAATPIPALGQPWLGGETPMNEIFDPPAQARGWLTAFDAESGNVRWKFQAPKPILAGVTPTAGGLVFNADLGGNFYAFDAENGRVLWQKSMGQSTGGGIVTYLANGKQRVAIASGMKSPVWPGASESSRIVVFALN